MPALRFQITATTDDAMAARKFNVIGGKGAILNLWASCANEGDTLGLSIGSKEILPQNSLVNVEAASGVVDIDRDHLIVDEIVPPGQIFMPSTLTATVAVLMTLRYV